MTYNTELEDIIRVVRRICVILYGPISQTNTILIKDTNSHKVRQEIIEKMHDADMRKLKYLDMAVYILDVGNDTLITLN